jgi:hypothetical protein
VQPALKDLPDRRAQRVIPEMSVQRAQPELPAQLDLKVQKVIRVTPERQV